jgi:hypothetical protein
MCTGPANVLTGTIVVMQKLARTANDAQNPMQSTHDMTASRRRRLVRPRSDITCGKIAKLR